MRFISKLRVEFAVLVGILCIAAGGSGIKNGRLDSMLDAANQAIRDIFNQTPNEIWISAQRTDSHGRGTQADPFDGSTREKFDALMASYSGVQNLHVHLGPATSTSPFHTFGLIAWQPQTGWWIEGAGMRATTIQQAVCSDALSTGHQDCVIGNSSAHMVTVSSLTIDCNYTALKAGQPSSSKGIQAVGVASGLIDLVRVIHGGGTSETFLLNFFVSGTGSTVPVSSIIQRSRVELCDDNATAFMCSASHTTNNSDTDVFGGQAIIRDCYTDGANVGYQINGYASGLVEGCTANNTVYPYTHDTLPQRNLTISHFKFQKPASNTTGQVITFAGGATAWVDQITIKDGTLDTNGNDVVEINLYNAATCVVEGNSFVSGVNGTFNSPFSNSNSSVTVRNNKFKTGRTKGDSNPALPAGVKSTGNRYMDNTIIPWLPDLDPAKTITASGQTGAKTINQQAGTVRFAASAQSITLTNSLITTTTKGVATVQTDDATAFACKFIAGNGTATLKLNAAATAETEVWWEIRN